MRSVVCAHWKAGLDNTAKMIFLEIGLPAYRFQINLQKSLNIKLLILRPYPHPPTHPLPDSIEDHKTHAQRNSASADLHTCTHGHVLSMLINSKNYKWGKTLHKRCLENVCVCVFVCVCVCVFVCVCVCVCVRERERERVKMRLQIKYITFSTKVEKSNTKDYKIFSEI